MEDKARESFQAIWRKKHKCYLRHDRLTTDKMAARDLLTPLS